MRKARTRLSAVCAIGITTTFAFSAHADPTGMTLTAAGSALFTLSTFADNFPITSSPCCGPLGIAFPTTGGVMVADYPGNVRVFATDTDGQQASAGAIGQNYGAGNGVGLASLNGNIYMTEQSAGRLVQLNNDGTFNHNVNTSLPFATGLAANSSNNVLYVSNGSNIQAVNATTGVATLFANAGADGLTLSADHSTLYAEVGSHILGFLTSNGSEVFDSGFIAGQADGVAIGATGALAGKLFVNTNSGTIVEIDIATLAQTLIATGGSRGDFVNVDPLNNTLLLTQTDDIIRLTPISGTFEGGNTPLPATLPLFASGAGVFGYLGWRRKKKATALSA